MVEIGDKGFVAPIPGGRWAFVPVSEAEVGDEGVLVPIAGGRWLAVPQYALAVGDPALAMPEAGGIGTAAIHYTGIPTVGGGGESPSVLATFGCRICGILAWAGDLDHILVALTCGDQTTAKYVATTDGGETWGAQFHEIPDMFVWDGYYWGGYEVVGYSLYYAINVTGHGDHLWFWDPYQLSANGQWSYGTQGYFTPITGETMTLDAAAVQSHGGRGGQKCIFQWGDCRAGLFRNWDDQDNKFWLDVAPDDWELRWNPPAGLMPGYWTPYLAHDGWSYLAFGTAGTGAFTSITLLAVVPREDHLIVHADTKVVLVKNDLPGILAAISPLVSKALVISPTGTGAAFYAGSHDLEASLKWLIDDGAGTLIGTGMHDRIFRSTDDFLTYSTVTIPGANLCEIAANGGDAWILDRTAGIAYHSVDKGVHWTPETLPAGYGNYTRVEHCGSYLVFGTDTGYLLKYPL